MFGYIDVCTVQTYANFTETVILKKLLTYMRKPVNIFDCHFFAFSERIFFKKHCGENRLLKVLFVSKTYVFKVLKYKVY